MSKNGICPSVSSSYVNLMLPVESTEFRCSVSCVTLPLFITSIVSSTNLFHSLGLQFTGAVAIARCSNQSTNKFAIMGDTRLPIAVPNLCWHITPRKVKYVVVTTNSNSSIMSSTFKFVLSLSPLSFSSWLRMISKASLTRIFVNSETTSCDTKHSPSSIKTHAISVASCWEFFTSWSVLSFGGASISANAMDVL